MPQNPPDGYHTITPQTIVEDARATIEFLQRVFDAEVKDVFETEGLIHHAEVQIGDSRLMLATPTEEFGVFPLLVNIYVDDVDATFARAVEHGATPLREPEDQFYGDRSGGVSDDQGNQWWISTHIEDVSPEDMQKRIAEMNG